VYTLVHTQAFSCLMESSLTWLQMKQFTSIAMKNNRFFTSRPFYFRCTRVHSNEYTDVEVGA